MNERIRQLAEQAGVTVLTTHGMEHVVDGCYVIGPARLEKFAELIVAHAVECVRDVLRDEESELTYGAAGQVQKRIKQHFGVEECWCESCKPNTMTDMRMIVCQICGNKRCPHATNHIYECTNSNEPGQKGSSWENYKVGVDK